MEEGLKCKVWTSESRRGPSDFRKRMKTLMVTESTGLVLFQNAEAIKHHSNQNFLQNSASYLIFLFKKITKRSLTVSLE